MTSLEESALLATQLLESWDATRGSAFAPPAVPPGSAWEEERRELFDAIQAELRIEEPGRDRLAACRYLLQNLAVDPVTSS